MNSKYIVLITILLSSLSCVQSQDINVSVEDLMTYNKWRLSNKRSYMNEEEQIFRQLVFFQNLKVINKHNSDPFNSYQVGINQFSDMTQEEFASKILNNQLSQSESLQSSFSFYENFNSSSISQKSPSVDWRKVGAVTQVKNQGSCGSCWTFSTAGLMESVNFIKNRKTSNLSEQQLLDCVTRSNGFYSYGCNGGVPEEALKYAAKFGVVEESQYPYVGVQGNCKITSPTNGFKPLSVVKVGQTVDDLKKALSKSPVAVAVDASNWGNYHSGVFNNCGTSLNHAVLAVGYDSKGNWIVKNSWATSWGESGFIRLSGGNTCGILNWSQTITA